MSVNSLLKLLPLRVFYTTLYLVILQLFFSVCFPCKLQAQEPSKSLQAWQIEGLKSAFFQPDSDVRAEMVKFCPPGFFSGLDKKVAKDFVPALIELFKNSDPDVRRSAADVLGEMGAAAKESVPALIELLKDSDPFVRGNAVDALGKIGAAAKESVPALIELLKDSDPFVRLSAADALGKMGAAAKESVPALIELFKDSDPFVRGNAADALGKMGPLGLHETLAILEKSYGYAEYRHTILFFAYYLSGGLENTHSQIIQIALAWLGEQTEAPLTKIKEDRDDGVDTLDAFLEVWEASTGLPNLREDLALKIAKVAKQTHWQPWDILLLQKHFDNLKAGECTEMDTVRQAIRQAIPFDPVGWFQTCGPLTKSLVLITIAYAALFIIGIMLLWLSPKVLLTGMRLPWDKLAQIRPEWAQFLINLLLTALLLPFFAKRLRVRKAWAEGFETGSTKLSDIPEPFVDIYFGDQSVRNAWVKQYLEKKLALEILVHTCESSFLDIRKF